MDLTLIIIIAIVVVIALFLVGLYNGLVTRRNRIDEAYAQIEVQLKRRHDLIPNLINAVKGYMGFEQKVLTEVTQARANAVAAGAAGRTTRRGRERPDRRPPFTVRRRRELSGPQGERQRQPAPGGADDDREPDELLAPALQRDGPRLRQLDPDVPRGPARGALGFTKREFFDAEPEAKQVPTVDLSLS